IRRLHHDTLPRVSLRVGDVIDMKEEEEEDAFAIVRAIFCHMAKNTNRYLFLIIDWFQATGNKDELLECPCSDPFPNLTHFRIGSTHFRILKWVNPLQNGM